MENGDDLHVFEGGGESNGADVVACDGEHEYVNHYWEEALMTRETCGMRSDSNFPPVGGTEADISENELDTTEKRAAQTSQGGRSLTRRGWKHYSNGNQWFWERDHTQ